jgi:hypothetical protein
MRLKVTNLNNAGVSLVSVLVSISVLAVCSYLLMTSYQTVFVTKSRINDQLSTFLFRARVMGVLGSQEGMARTIAKNPIMSCMNDKVNKGCLSLKSSAPIPIKLVDANDTVLTDPSNPSLGFAPDGSICTSYNSSSGNDACPFRFDITWKPICDPDITDSCYNPQSEVKASFTAKARTKNTAVFQSSNMDFTIYPAAVINNAQNQCSAFGGTFNQAAGTCALPMYQESECPPGYIVKNLNNNGTTFNCALLLSGTCPPGQAVSGVDTNNKVTCKSIYPCPPKTYFSTWDPSAAVSGDGGDGGDGGGDGCDGADGSDGCS